MDIYTNSSQQNELTLIMYVIENLYDMRINYLIIKNKFHEARNQLAE